MSFKIQTLSNNLADGVYYAWRTYNPNNIDVVKLKERWYDTGDIYRIPAEFKAWIDLFYQNRTPFTNYDRNIDLFGNNTAVESLLNEFPQIYRPPYNPFMSAMKAMIMGTSDKWLRLALFEFCKDWCLEEFAGRYFIEKKGTYANTTANSQALIYACEQTKKVFDYLYNKFNSRPAPSDWKSYLGGAINVIGVILTEVFSIPATVATPLFAFLGQIADSASTVKYNPNTGETSIYKADGSLLYQKAGTSDYTNILLAGAGLFLIYQLSKKPATKTQKV